MQIEFAGGASTLRRRKRRGWWKGWRLSMPVLSRLLALCLTSASTASAQAIRGVVVDEATDRPADGVYVHLLATDSTRMGAGALTDSAGRFTVRPLRTGHYRLEVDEIGYARIVTGLIDIDTTDVTVKLVMQPQAIVLDSIVVQARGRELYHAATYESLYARHAISPHAGPNRVFVRDDPAFERARDVRDLIRLIRSFTCTPYVYWNGMARGNSANARALLETPTSMLEGVEYFQDITALPFAYSAGAALPSEIRACGVVALWTRRPGR